MKKALLITLGIMPFITGYHIHPFIPLVTDVRLAKEAIALALAISISLYAIYQYGFPQFKNKWLLFLIAYMVISIWYTPKFGRIKGVEDAAFWVYKPLSYSLIYFLMFMGIRAIPFSTDDLKKIFKVLTWVGTIMCGFVGFQWFKLDQFYILKSYEIIGQPTQAGLGGTFGHPALVASFLVIIIPMAMYLRKFWQAGVMAFTVFFLQNQLGIIALITISWLGFFILYPKYRMFSVFIVILGILAMIFSFVAIQVNTERKERLFEDNGRFTVWQGIVEDMKTPPVNYSDNKIMSKKIYPFTGLGLGSYRYIYTLKHKTKFYQAHNEWLEFMYNSGLIGLALMVITMTYFLITGYRTTPLGLTLYLAFLTTLIYSVGHFIWQVEPHRFLTVLLLGFISKKEVY